MFELHDDVHGLANSELEEQQRVETVEGGFPSVTVFSLNFDVVGVNAHFLADFVVNLNTVLSHPRFRVVDWNLFYSVNDEFIDEERVIGLKVFDNEFVDADDAHHDFAVSVH